MATMMITAGAGDGIHSAIMLNNIAISLMAHGDCGDHDDDESNSRWWPNDVHNDGGDDDVETMMAIVATTMATKEDDTRRCAQREQTCE